MTGVTRRSARRVATALLVLAIAVGLGGCQVYSATSVSSIGEVDFVKECGPTRTAVLAVNRTNVRYDIWITADGVLRAQRDAVAPGGAVHWSAGVDATQAQVSFLRSGGDGSGLLTTDALPSCR